MPAVPEARRVAEVRAVQARPAPVAPHLVRVGVRDRVRVRAGVQARPAPVAPNLVRVEVTWLGLGLGLGLERPLLHTGTL